MKCMYLLMVCLALYARLPLHAQTASDIGKIVLGIDLPENASEETVQLREILVNKFNNLAAQSGCTSFGYTNFIVAPNVVVEDVQMAEGGMKNVYVVKGNMYVNVIERNSNNVYSSIVYPFKGFATKKELAIKNAILDLSLTKVQSLFEQAKVKIVEYYRSNKDMIFSKATTYAKCGEYEQAITFLMSIPDEVSDVKQEALIMAEDIYQQEMIATRKANAQKIAACNDSILNLARSYAAMHNPQEALNVLSDYQTNGTSQDATYRQLVAKAETQVSAAERAEHAQQEREYKDQRRREDRAWTAHMQETAHRQEMQKQTLHYAYRLSQNRINALKSIAVTYLRTRPRTIIYY